MLGPSSTEALIRCAHVHHEAQRGQRFGVEVNGVTLDWQKVKQHIKSHGQKTGWLQISKDDEGHFVCWKNWLLDDFRDEAPSLKMHA